MALEDAKFIFKMLILFAVVLGAGWLIGDAANIISEPKVDILKWTTVGAFGIGTIALLYFEEIVSALGG